MAVYFMISIISGILFAILDGVINANPLAKKYYAILLLVKPGNQEFFHKKSHPDPRVGV